MTLVNLVEPLVFLSDSLSFLFLGLDSLMVQLIQLILIPSLMLLYFCMFD